MRIGTLVLSCVLALFVVPSRTSAQRGTAPAPITLRNVVSLNPLLVMFEWFNAEYERQASETSTAGIRASRFTTSDGDFRYLSGRGFYRYYPNGAFAGFFAGLAAGVTAVNDEDDDFNALAVGIELGYTWMLGARRQFYVSIGSGVDRLLTDVGDATQAIPTLRLVNIGLAF